MSRDTFSPPQIEPGQFGKTIVPKEQSVEGTDQKGVEVALDVFRRRQLADTIMGEVFDSYDTLGNGSRNDIAAALKTISDDEKKRYWGHGVTRGHPVEQLTAIINILEDGLLVGSIAPLAGAPQTAYRNGSFLVLSSRDNSLGKRKSAESHRSEVRIYVDPKTGEMIQPATVLSDDAVIFCNGDMSHLAAALQERYPERRIMTAEELPSYFQEQESRQIH